MIHYATLPHMAKETVTIRIDKEQHDELASERTASGLPIAVQIRRAIRQWLADKPRSATEQPQSD